MDNNNTPDNQIQEKLLGNADIERVFPENETSEIRTDALNMLQASNDQYDKALETIITKALDQVKSYVLQADDEEQKVTRQLIKTLSINDMDEDSASIIQNPAKFYHLVGELLESKDSDGERDNFVDLVNSFFGEDAVKAISQKLTTENIDVIVENVLGADMKKMICDRMQSNSLDDLLNKLVEEKLKQDSDQNAFKSSFDELIENILGKETEEFIKKNLDKLLCNMEHVDDAADLETTVDAKELD